MLATQIARLKVFPIKSCAGIEVQRIEATEYGPAHDRILALTSNGRYLSQRTAPRLACIKLSLEADHYLATAPHHGSIKIPFSPDPTARDIAFSLRWLRPAIGASESKEVNAFFSDYLNQQASLVRILRHHKNIPSLSHTPNKTNTFRDYAPWSLISLGSLAALNQHTTEPIPEDRFRANIAIGTPETLAALPPYVEDICHVLRINGHHSTLLGPTRRCGVLNVNQETGLTDPIPWVTNILKTHRLMQDPTDNNSQHRLFGQNLVFEPGTSIEYGDKVELITYRDAAG